MIRIGSGHAFWGDWPQAAALQVRSGPLDYLVMDYLAEVTVSILDKQRRRDPETGYAHDFVNDVGPLLPEMMERKIRVVTSAGGVNPRACGEALLARARDLGVGGLRVGVVSGDDSRNPRFGSPCSLLTLLHLSRCGLPAERVARL